MTDQNKNLDFEASLTELEQLVQSLENDNLSLDKSLATFEQGIKLSRTCQQALDQAEQKVSILLGETEQPFDNSTLNDE
ncbi:exodeoxyribonuclease VII small subunit [Litoribrevibacter albus]|uniref:Exodeoxyribonuclease 7 small subunit n=1 Tax=Litoribrevibacter albus TaxID=1473156 RepID=A0AA37SDT3_9GAMM|nr:exodeoxyribonuclease VII small subunit [Litoribrevibacter albus]GLQ33436.1 exodeoxyribonuclease 7 small subunit [Litoribrevibacter albus]